MAERVDAVLTVIYLVFNEGYTATRGEQLIRADLAKEAIRLGRVVMALMGPQPAGEVVGLLALMLLHDARSAARTDPDGNIIVLEEQNRKLWNRNQIVEALPLVEAALHDRRGPYALQAAIAAEHCKAARPEDTDWRAIVKFYEELGQIQPSPVVVLNQAVAIAMAESPAAGLAKIEELAANGELNSYHLLHAARADLLRRMGVREEAAQSYRRAMELATNQSERRYLERRLRELSTA
jgi:RNA polymerase sigma-70 factor (ECF subfamily)